MLKRLAAILIVVFIVTAAPAGASSSRYTTIHTQSGFGKLFVLAADNHGNLYVVDQVKYTIDKISPAGKLLLRFPMPHQCGISGVAATNSGVVYAIPNCQSQVYRFSPSGTLLQKFGKQPSAGGVAVDAQGHVYVAYSGGGPHPPPGKKVKTFRDRFIEYSSTGKAMRTVNLPSTSNAFGIAVAPSGMVYVSTQEALVRVSTAGQIVKRWPSLRPTANSLPLQPAVDSSGAVYYASGSALTLSRISNTGAVSVFVKAGNAPTDVKSATGLAVSGNHLFVADGGPNEIKEFTLQGKLAAIWTP